MIRITPHQFKEAFLQVVSTMQTDLIGRWDNSKEYTSFMRQTILPAIAPRLCVQVYSHDYYTLDCIYFTKRDTVRFRSEDTYATHISIALEPENDIKDTAIEMNKLQLFNAPLKVLITYCERDSERDSYLKRYNNILCSADVFGDFATLRRQMVIFGSKPCSTINWHFYIYEPCGFQELRA